jgi:hypothetical protein
MDKYYYNEAEVMRVIEKAIDDFYTALLDKVNSLNIKEILKKKNPYLYKVKGCENASDMVRVILDAFISSSEETIFGNVFFEPLAIVASGGVKSMSEGVDLEYRNRNDNTIYVVAVKSSTVVYNKQSKDKQIQDFDKIAKLAQQARMAFYPIIGYGYGRKDKPKKPKSYYEIAGQQFWYKITGDPDFYKKIIDYIGEQPKKYIDEYNLAYDKAFNRLIRGFSADFCLRDGSINWDKIVELSSKATKLQE